MPPHRRRAVLGHRPGDHPALSFVRYRHVGAALGLSVLAGGCGGGRASNAGATRAELERDALGQVAELLGSRSDDRTRDARLREAAARATGALLVPALEAGVPKLAVNGARVRYTCGATLVSPSYAVTAAHCVDDATADLGALTLELYRPTAALVTHFDHATTLTGTFPDYLHEPLGAADGYFVDRYPCTLAARCGDDYGVPVACDPALSSIADVALVRCAGRPGDAAGFLAVAFTDDPDAEIFMPWKHELYAVPPEPTSDLFLHYSVLAGEVAANYHYLGSDAAGAELHQLLPLGQPGDGPVPRKLGPSGSGVGTDLLGCHGTSGSAALQPGAAGRWEVLGPAIHGNEELSSYLCNHVPSLGAPHGPGLPGVAYGNLSLTQWMLDFVAIALTDDCSALPAGATTLVTHLPCWRDALASSPDTAVLADHLVAATVRERFDVDEAPVLALGPGERVGLPGFVVEVGRRYRFGASLWSAAGCVGASCPSVTLRVGGAVASTAVLKGSADPVPWAVELTAAASGALLLELTAGGAGIAEIGGISLVPAAATLGFDTARERLAVVLAEADAPDAVMAMRFVGDGRAGFAVRLLPGERALFPRLALVEGGAWSVSFAATGGAALACGLLDAAGQELVGAGCTDGVATLVPTSADGVTPAALFVTNEGPSPATLDALFIDSGVPGADADGDGIPDALGTCNDCCPLGSRLVRGTEVGEVLVATEPACIVALSGDDVVVGSPGADYLWGGEGADHLGGGEGDDTLFGGPGADVITAGTGPVTVLAGPGADTVFATHAARARISGGPGADRLFTGDGDDTVWPGPDTLLVDTGAGDDTVVLYASCELHAGLRLLGGPGHDELRVPVTAAELAALGVIAEGFESIVVDATLTARAACGGPP